MTLAIICSLGAIIFLIGLQRGDSDNKNGRSVSFLQLALANVHRWFINHTIVAFVLLAYPRILAGTDIITKQAKIERLVWIRLLVISLTALVTEGLLSQLSTGSLFWVRVLLILYVLLVQFTLLMSLLRPLFGVSIDVDTGKMDIGQARKRTPKIPAPRRSLLMALVNFFEILLAWAIIYRCIMPDVVKTMDQANYFSVVTVTTLGYGDVNAGQMLPAQLAVTANMLIVLIFSICHITTIIGAMSSDTDFPPET